MTIMKKIIFHVAYYGIAIIKLPFCLIGLMGLLVDKIGMWLMTRVVKWHGDDEIIDVVNDSMNLVSDFWEDFGDTYLDMKIEL